VNERHRRNREGCGRRDEIDQVDCWAYCDIVCQ
jgi:hypothetical protein